MSESLVYLKAIRDGAKEFDKTSLSKVKGIKIFDGWYRWFLNDNSYSKIFENEDFDGVVQIERSLSDINRIIDLTEALLLISDLSLVTGDEGIQKHLDSLLTERNT